jgi:hypothetical protein
MRLSQLAAIDADNSFSLVVMSTDGETKTDSVHDTIESAEKESGDMGSRWIFYPFHFAVDGEGKAWPLFDGISPEPFSSQDKAREWAKAYGQMFL